ncbi:MAG TPA: ATP-binding protein [Candidatus Dormibacteraeota bacterium]|nr:ATP-binding protein [Candidatus Dormibacteraeota bacterium]
MQSLHPTRVAVIGSPSVEESVLARIFRDAGHDVREAPTPEQVAFLTSQLPELVVLRMGSSESRDLEVCRQIRKNPRMAGAAVMLVSPSFTSSSARTAALDAGADACLGEPLEAGEVLAQADCILKLRKVEAELRESEERFRLATEAMNGLVYDWDLRTGIAKRSTGMACFLGWRPEEVPEDNLWWPEQIHPEDAPIVQATFQEALTRKAPECRHEYRVRHKKGHYLWIWDSNRIVYDRAGRPLRVIGCAVSVDDRKRVEQALRSAKEGLARANEELQGKVAERAEQLRETVMELESWSYSIAHNMRAPLRTMTGFSRLLLDEYGPRLDGHGQNFLERINIASARLDQFITDLLDYGMILRGEIPLEGIAPQQLIEEILATYPDIAANCDVRTETALPSIVANAAALTQVIANLLSNAVKFQKPGVRPEVRIRAERRELWVRLWFEDNGIGIDEAAHERIFGIFQSLHPSGTYEGTGIGLAIVRRAMLRMGGRVGVESRPGEGSRFWVELKAAPDP